jgi:hypothetical protein
VGQNQGCITEKEGVVVLGSTLNEAEKSNDAGCRISHRDRCIILVAKPIAVCRNLNHLVVAVIIISVIIVSAVDSFLIVSFSRAYPLISIIWLVDTWPYSSKVVANTALVDAFVEKPDECQDTVMLHPHRIDDIRILTSNL